MNGQYPELEAKMQKCIDALVRELASVRAGRANAAVLDRVSVDYFGTPTPVNQIASVAVPEARSLTITPWDPTMLKPLEKAILQSDIGINPINDGKTLRLNFPPLTEERRRDLAKLVKKSGEETKIAVRNIRRDGLDKYKAMKKKSEITEDDLRLTEKDLNELAEKYVKETDKTVAEKEKEILEV